MGFWASSLRNIMRLIDMIPFPFYAVGSVGILATSHNQRLGDLAGGTVVVRVRTAAGAVLADRPWTDSASGPLLRPAPRGGCRCPPPGRGSFLPSWPIGT